MIPTAYNAIVSITHLPKTIFMTNDTDKSKTELIAELEDLRFQVHNCAGSHSCEDHRFRELVDGLPQSIYEMSPTGQVTYANEFALSSLGYTQEDLEKGLNAKDVVLPDDYARVCQTINTLMKSGGTSNQEYMAVRKDGSTFPVRIYSQAIFQKGKPIGLRGAVVNLSEIREGALYHQALFENTGTAMTIYGEDAVIRSCNTQFQKLSGYSKAEIEGNMKWTDFVEPGELKQMKAYHAKRIREGESAPTDYEFTFLSRGSIPKRVHVFVKVIPGTEERVTSLIDLTRRIQAEEKMRLSEERYALVVRGANDGIWDWDLATDQVYFSPRYKGILGFDDDEFPNEADAWKDRVHPNDIDRVFEENMKCIQGEVDHFQVEYRMRHKDGSYRWVLGRGASEKNPQGKVYRLGGTHTDVTERKQVEAQHRELIENASDGIYQCTPEGTFISANNAMARHMGYDSPQDLISSVKDIESQMWGNPGGRKEFIQLLESHEKLENYEIKLIKKDGSIIWASENVRAVFDDENGKLLYYEGFLQDITERKLHERTTNALYAISKAITTTRNLQHLYENIHAVLGEVIDATNFLISMVDEERDVLELPYFSDESDDYTEITNISDPNKSSLALHVLRTGEPLFISRANPEDIALQESINVIGTPSAVWLGVPLKLKNKIIGVMAVQHYTNPHHYSKSDVTFMEAVSEQVALALERKANEEELTTLNEELEYKVEARTAELQEQAAILEQANTRLTELDEIKSGLVSSVSHELRTPLTSIRGFAKLTGKDFKRYFEPLAAEPKLEKKATRIRKNLDIIENEGERLTRLINDFLDINRIESGKASWHDTFINPCEIVHKAVSALAGAFAAKENVELITNLPETIPPVHADPDKIQQVIINLLNNASKFTEKGSVTVSMKADIDHLTLTVTDTGMGIAKDELPNIFEKFHKSHSGDTVIKDRGTGLGLAICREIVAHYGGHIWVDSDLGKGSEFSFTLPIVAGTETACTP